MDKIITVGINRGTVCETGWVIFNEEEEIIKRIIVYNQFSSDSLPVYYDYINNEEGVERYIPSVSGNAMARENNVISSNDGEACYSCIVSDWAKITRRALSIVGLGVTIYSKVGSILILAKNGVRWQSAIQAIAGSSAIWNQDIGNSPGLSSGRGIAATRLQRAQQGVKWLRRAGYAASAVFIISDTYSVWVETKDLKATLTQFARGTAEVIALIGLAKGVGWGLAALATITGLAAGAPIIAAIAVAAGTFAIVAGIYAAWKYFEVEDLVVDLVQKAAGLIVGWWQKLMEILGNAVNRLARAVEWSAERLANHGGFSLLPESYMP